MKLVKKIQDLAFYITLCKHPTNKLNEEGAKILHARIFCVFIVIPVGGDSMDSIEAKPIWWPEPVCPVLRLCDQGLNWNQNKCKKDPWIQNSRSFCPLGSKLQPTPPLCGVCSLWHLMFIIWTCFTWITGDGNIFETPQSKVMFCLSLTETESLHQCQCVHVYVVLHSTHVVH